jgi:hypothetical protein
VHRAITKSGPVLVAQSRRVLAAVQESYEEGSNARVPTVHSAATP